MYTYIPYRNQDELPIFDTGLPDFNMVELFRSNRYVGDDRIGDANQLAFGLTSRLFNESTGTQYLSATLGEIRYFTLPRVLLPNEITQTLPGQTLPTLPGQTANSSSSCRDTTSRPCPARPSPPPRRRSPRPITARTS